MPYIPLPSPCRYFWHTTLMFKVECTLSNLCTATEAFLALLKFQDTATASTLNKKTLHGCLSANDSIALAHSNRMEWVHTHNPAFRTTYEKFGQRNSLEQVKRQNSLFLISINLSHQLAAFVAPPCLFATSYAGIGSLCCLSFLFISHSNILQCWHQK